MNIILIDKNDFCGNNRVILTDRRFHQIYSVLNVKVGDNINIGKINGSIGNGKIININNLQVEVEITLNRKPPTPLPLTLILSLPRPKTVKKVIPAAVSMGVKNIILINSYRVEKSYWQSPVISKDSLNKLSRLGLEQGFDTTEPTIIKANRFKPFVEDKLPEIIKHRIAIVPHIGNNITISKAEENREYVVAIGPEGGFIPYEIDMLSKIGFTPVTLGDRILRVENAAVAAIAKLF